MGTQRLEADDGGRPVLRKLGRPGAEADRLRREAAALQAAAHPGVVRLLGVEEDEEGGVALRLAVAGTRTFADLRTDLATAARVLAGLATTLGDLHDLGLVHGRVAAEHVVLDGEGRAVLCGFAEAGPRGERDPADDVLGLGLLLTSTLHRTSTSGGSAVDRDWEPIPERRFGRRDRWLGFVRRSLLTLADQATADDPVRRPSARAFAAALLAAAPAPEAGRGGGWVAAVGRWRAEGRADAPPRPEEPLDAVALLRAADPDEVDEPSGPARLGRLAVPLGGAVGLGLLVFGIGALLRPVGGPPSAAAPGPAVTATSPPTTGASTSTGATAPPVTDAPTTTSTPNPCDEAPPPTADPDGDGCASSVRVGDAVVEVDGVRYGVGRPGDLLAVGDWDCDGAATVAVVHRDTGEVFVFDGWATGTGEATAASLGTVPGARAIEPLGDGCGGLVVVGADGARTEVPA